jgi:hypothetical protein
MSLPEYVQNWVNIENVSFWEIGKKFLRENPITDCETKSLINCKDTDICDIYTSQSTEQEKCVTKERIQSFNENVIFQDNSKDKKQYRFLYFIYSERSAKKIKNIEDTFRKNHPDNPEIIKDMHTIINYHCFCYVVESLTDGSIYILFSSGKVLRNDELYSGPIDAFIDTIVGVVETLEAPIYLCGHSMGCVLAQITGLKIIEKNPVFFRENCTVIGSAPFRWSVEEDIHIYRDYLDKFHIFVLGLNDNIIDPFFYKGDTTLQQIYPINLLNSNENTTTLELIQEPITRTPGDNSIHRWLSYKQHFDNYILSKKGGYKKYKINKKSKKDKKGKKDKKTIKNKNKKY